MKRLRILAMVSLGYTQVKSQQSISFTYVQFVVWKVLPHGNCKENREQKWEREREEENERERNGIDISSFWKNAT